MGSWVSHETYLSINEDVKDKRRYSAKFEDNYFAEGVSRRAFKGTLYGDGPRDQTACVTKVFKSEYAQHFVQMVPNMAASKKAYDYAKKFRWNHFRQIRKFTSNNEIEFIIPLVAKMKEISRFDFVWLIPTLKDERYVKLYQHVALEPYIQGQYDKFNSNSGYEQRMHELVTAFCHWTWYFSGHKLMVCDLQGVKSGRKYILTDPAIHSHDRRFGNTDLGLEGMERVLGNHQCNALCRELGLNNPMAGTYVPRGRRSTTYSFQVSEEDLLRRESRYFQTLPAIME